MTAAVDLRGLARTVLGDEREAAIRPSLEERERHLALVAERAGRVDAEPAPVYTALLERLVRPASSERAALANDLDDSSPSGSRADRVAACLRRIADHDGALRSFVAVDAEGALATAAALDASAERRPLDGMPIAVKDVVDVAGLPTEAGSALLAGNRARADAAVVARARSAGAVVVGKTACTELATNDPAPTRNPWNAAHTPGGSSPGSAVAVATGMCDATIDTQTAGDVLRPAAFNGVVGFKPTYGRVSRAGTLAVAWSIDTIGVQARSVADAARLYAAIAGADAADAATTALPLDPVVTPRRRPPRLGRVRDHEEAHAGEEVRAHVEAIVSRARDAGAEVVDLDLCDALEVAHAAHRTICFAECATLHAERLARDADRMGPKLRTLLELGAVTPATAYVQAQRVRAALVASAHAALEGVDAIATAAAPTPAPRDLAGTGDAAMLIPWTLFGFPAVSIPTGLSADGLPLAVQLVGRPFADGALLSVAGWAERTVGVRLDPAPRLRA